MGINERLLTLRHVTGLTQKDFAPLIGIRQAHYSQIEKGLRPLGESHRRSLVELFNLEPDYFETDAIAYSASSLNYRRRKLSARQVAMATATFGLIEQYLTRDHGPSELPPVSEGPIKSKRSTTEIAKLAAETRRLIGIPQDKAINNVTRCMQRIGILVAPLENPQLEVEKIDGISTPSYRFKPFVTTLNYQVPGDRFRFSAAHELGHIMLHSAGHDGSLADRESEADAFAAEFLMPRSAFMHLLSPDLTLNSFARLKTEWGVSIQALIRRNLDLGFIDRDRYRSLNIQVANRGWKKREPIPIPVEKVLNPAPRFVSEMKVDQLAAANRPGPIADVLDIASFRGGD